MHRVARRIVAVVALVMGQAITWPFAMEYLAEDRCTEAGGSFDYQAARCDFKDSHPSTAIWDRHGASLLTALAISLAGCALLIQGRR